MSALHPKRRLYAALDEWLAAGNKLPAVEDKVGWLAGMLMWSDNLGDIPREDLRRYAESWLAINIVPTRDLG